MSKLSQHLAVVSMFGNPNNDSNKVKLTGRFRLDLEFSTGSLTFFFFFLTSTLWDSVLIEWMFR